MQRLHYCSSKPLHRQMVAWNRPGCHLTTVSYLRPERLIDAKGNEHLRNTRLQRSRHGANSGMMYGQRRAWKEPCMRHMIDQENIWAREFGT